MRSAAGGEQGHQRTPAMIEAVLKDAKAAVNGEEQTHIPGGGFTDVGLHTGGERRDIAWPLVREVFRVRLVISYSRSLISTKPFGITPYYLGSLFQTRLAPYSVVAAI